MQRRVMGVGDARAGLICGYSVALGKPGDRVRI